MPAPEQHAGIDPAEPEAVGQRILDSHWPCLTVDDVHAFCGWVRIIEIQGGRHDLIANRQ